jgi:integrase
MASLYKRGKKYWATYYVNGEQIKKSLETADERVAKNKFKKIEYELAIGELEVASKLPLPMILESFCQELKANRTFKSYKNDFSRLRIFFGPVCESLKVGVAGTKLGDSKKQGYDKFEGKHIKADLLEDVTPQMIYRFISERKQDSKWSPKTVNLLRQTLHKLFSFAIKHYNFKSRDRKAANPAAVVSKDKESAPNIRFLKKDDITKQLEILKEEKTIHAMVATYIYAGLRREEALWLTHDDIDLDKKLIKVQAKEIDGEYWQPKTKKNRVVPISSDLFDILKNYHQPFNCVWFFPSPTGKKWDTDNFSQDLREINKKYSLDWSCLDFRHTFGSHLAQNGVSLYKISTLMGNSPEICRRHYAALIPEEMADVVEFNNSANEDDSEAKELLKEILDEMRDRKANGVKPKIRLVR